MNREQIETMLQEIGIEYRYYNFEEEELEPPYMYWYTPEVNNFAADGKAYFSVCELRIGLYTGQKNWEQEKKIEEVLEKYEIFWKKTETWIESEALYEVLYEMEV